MASFLKPNKWNLIGTGALLVASYLGSFISGLVSRFAMQPQGGSYAGNVSGMAGRAAGAARTGGFGLIGGAANLVILAVLFYVVIAFVMDKSSKEPAAKEAQKSEKR